MPSAKYKSLDSSTWAAVVASIIAAAVVVLGIYTPLGDDDLFWWIPSAMWSSESGLAFVAELPSGALMYGVEGVELPRQWSNGLPDYGHPPLWFWWLSLWISIFGESAVTVHAAVVPVAALFGWGLAELLRRLGGRMAPWGTVAVLLLPSVQAQMVAVDTDVPLLMLSVWALVALMDRKLVRFGLISSLAVWCKEPAVLLALPALAVIVYDRRWSWGWLAPIVALGVWGAVHWHLTGWAFAGSERLPESFSGWLSDLGDVSWFVFGAQGRWLVVVLVGLSLLKARVRVSRAWVVVGAYVVSQVLFYSTVNFLGGIERESQETHLRYLNGPTVLASIAGVAAMPIVAVPLLGVSLLHTNRPATLGPEGSMCGAATETTMIELADFLAGEQGEVWVGSYAYTQLTRPYAGVVDLPVLGLKTYSADTDPVDVSGVVVHRANGEPLGRLQELDFVEIERFGDDCGWVSVLEVGDVVRSPPAP